jgi:arabinan endo-1,5-alpha-L-arabinosidase
VKDDAGQYWMLYHGFDAADPDGGRKVYLDQITWDKDGWPIVRNRVPSATANVPVFGNETSIRTTMPSTENTKPSSLFSLGGMRTGYHTPSGILIGQYENGQSRKIMQK